MSRKRRANEEGSVSGSWLTTYGDLVTLLLTFFVLLFSFSTIDAKKWEELVGALTGSIGVLDGGSIVLPDEGSYYDDFTELSPEDLERLEDINWDTGEDNVDKFLKLYQDIGLFLEEQDIPAEVQISKEYTEILIRFKDSILFDTGQADIKSEAEKILDGIALVLNTYQDNIDKIRIDGHADSRPINTYLYPTNWELSSRRAVNVVRYFHEKKNIEPSKLSAAAYGSFRPIDSNDTEEGMARNRRVEIFIERSLEPIGTINTEKE